MNIFKYLDYKAFLNEMIRRNRGVYGYKTKLAQAAKCRNSYFSQVLNADFDLAPEHALGLADFWDLSAPEKDYLIQLVHYARAGTPELRRYHESLLKRMAAEHERESLKGNAQEVAEDWKSLFYSSWHYTAIHELTTFPGGMGAEAIARRIELPSALVQQVLRELEKMGLVEGRGSAWHAKVVEIIVPVGTHYATQHVAHWTSRAAQSALSRKHRLEPLHKCWVFGISPGDYHKVRQLVLDHIGKCQKIIPASERKELVCMNLNLFEV